MKPEPARASDEAPVKRLLADCGLPFEDITATHLQHFWVLRTGAQLAGVVGLEVLGRYGLLRSLAVESTQRGRGIGALLTEQAEAYARSMNVEELYLLTTTAGGFFAGRDYEPADRASVPEPLRQTTEFQSLCPSSAICLKKHLSLR
jgi:amino-acid N-acetyltransferase